jgi:hypothetical protein
LKKPIYEPSLGIFGSKNKDLFMDYFARKLKTKIFGAFFPKKYFKGLEFRC